MLKRLLRLVVKELQALLGQRQGRIMLIMPVILQTLLFPFAATLDVRDSTLLIVDQDGGAASRELTLRLARTASFTQVIAVHGEAEMRSAIDNQRALLAVRFGPDFSRRIARGESAPLQIVIDGRRSNAGQIAASYAQEVIAGYLAERGGPAADPGPRLRNEFNPNLDFKWHILPSLVGIITTIGCLMVTALSVSREREEGTFEQLLVSPLTPAYIMAGKAIPGILVAMVQGTLIAAIAHGGYGVPYTGSVPLLFVGMFCYGLALAGVGLFISSISSTQQQAFLGVFAFMVPATIVSGFVAPIENMPALLQGVARVDALAYFIPIVKGLFLKSYGWADVWPRLWPMLAIATFTLTVALRMFRRHIA
ncbi:MAG: ABC transporter permease [Burkholderiales bacterium]|nr:ABC transporter permease [Burkholderiales bacterium]MDE1928862.1 ABC transporter permease [Burkholderiales bacterium]MDE2159372.1 ABC transporter permease [Burkholderiales bacterium]MDE2502948.1 ABC transporter permease [Burkholderiales bacterium]